MMKKIFTIAFLALTLGSVSSTATTSASIEIIDVDQQIDISVVNNSIRVVGGNGMKMEIYNLTGVCVKTVSKIEGFDKSFQFNLSKGCYIVKVGKIARKITIK